MGRILCCSVCGDVHDVDGLCTTRATDFELLQVIDEAPGPTVDWDRATDEAMMRAIWNAIKESPEYAATLKDRASGPVCEDMKEHGQCSHRSCELIYEDIPPFDFCHEDGWQIITESGGGTGFAGGSIYWDVLFCGHTHMDESDDVRAAQ